MVLLGNTSFCSSLADTCSCVPFDCIIRCMHSLLLFINSAKRSRVYQQALGRDEEENTALILSIVAFSTDMQARSSDQKNKTGTLEKY